MKDWIKTFKDRGGFRFSWGKGKRTGQLKISNVKAGTTLGDHHKTWTPNKKDPADDAGSDGGGGS